MDVTTVADSSRAAKRVGSAKAAILTLMAPGTRPFLLALVLAAAQGFLTQPLQLRSRTTAARLQQPAMAMENNQADRRTVLKWLPALAAATLPLGKAQALDLGEEFARMDRGSASERGTNAGPPPPPTMTRNKKGAGGTVNAVLNAPSGSGRVAITFDSPWNEKKNAVLEYGDKESRGDAFVTARALTAKKAVAVGDVTQKEVLDILFDKESKFATYGPPVNIKINADSSSAGLRQLDISFTAQGPSLTVDRRILCGLRTVGPDAYAVVAGAPKIKFSEAAADAQKLVSSLGAAPALSDPKSMDEDD